MSISFDAQATRTVVKLDGVDRVAFNEDGSMELLTPPTNPTGNKLPTAGQVLGLGQTWQDVTASRAANTTYTNTTGRPIVVFVRLGTAAIQTTELLVNDVVTTSWICTGSTVVQGAVTIVPNGATYRAVNTQGGATVQIWTELR